MDSIDVFIVMSGYRLDSWWGTFVLAKARADSMQTLMGERDPIVIQVPNGTSQNEENAETFLLMLEAALSAARAK